MRKLALLTTLTLIVITVAAAPKNRTEVESLRGEKWWGRFNEIGDSKTKTTSMLVSSAGRYIWSNTPFEVLFNGSNLSVGSDVEKLEVHKGGKTLREALLVCCHKNFPPQGVVPPVELFSNPIYNPQSEMGDSFTQDDVINYASRIVSEGLPKGIILIPDGWQKSSMKCDFDPTTYPNPAAMTEQLHKMGFKIMVTITPFTVASGREFIIASQQGEFIESQEGTPQIFHTDIGYQVCRNLGNSKAVEQTKASVEEFISQYDIDAVRFDCRDVLPSLHNNPQTMTAFMAGWTSLGNSVKISEYMPEAGPQAAHHVNCVQSNGKKGWQAMHEQLKELLMASLSGCSYNHSVPVVDNDKSSADQQFMLRSMQLAAALPVMNVDFAPWRITDPSLSAQLRKTFELRSSMGNYITEMVNESARTAEPLIRHMEYQFPRNGFSDCDDQFMLGSKYLFAPMFDASGKRMVRLPRGIWTDYSGKRFRGPIVINVDASKGDMIYYELTTK